MEYKPYKGKHLKRGSRTLKIIASVALAVLVALAILFLTGGAKAIVDKDKNDPATRPTEGPHAAQTVAEYKDTTPEVVEPHATPDDDTDPVEESAPADTGPEWIDFIATAYCPCEICCGSWALNRPDGIVYTASGAVAKEGVTIAADWTVLPPGTVVYIDGIGERVVHDRGSAVKGNAVDLYFPDHDAARQFGRQAVRLYIVRGAE